MTFHDLKDAETRAVESAKAAVREARRTMEAYDALRTAARAVVEAWSSSYGWTVASEDKLSNAIIALRAALESPE